ncbi:uncharacterized mitochondrial protein AtMg00810-like [Rutidosis leptorrhynchoides]|uniref:uncharacterized mitochondrial protein AtMg00810-like n=1 Tax=Rutidosis leptorrhynchoides TaxID=125765 RepID=UPI003A9A6660
MLVGRAVTNNEMIKLYIEFQDDSEYIVSDEEEYVPSGPQYDTDGKNSYTDLSRPLVHGFNVLQGMLSESGSDTSYLLLYVDDIVLTTSSTGLLQRIISSLYQEFAMTDLGPLNYFLGIHATRTASGIFLSQRQYANEIIVRADMSTCHPCWNLVESGAKLTAHGPPVKDPTLYRSLAVQQICLFMHDPREQHLYILKRIIRYVQGTPDFGLQLYASSPTSLVAYSDADWAGCPTTRRSTSGYCVFLGNNLLSWSSKRKLTPSRSSAKAEYRGVANVVVETCWIRN